MPMPARALANLAAEMPLLNRNPVADRKLRLVREAIERSGWKFDAVASALGLKAGYDLSKLLSGEKKFTAEHWERLPDDIEKILAKLYAEACGHAVVNPLPAQEAVGQLLMSIGHAMTTGAIAALPGAGPVLKMDPK